MVQWDTSWSNARRIADDAITETERQHIVPILLTKAIKVHLFFLFIFLFIIYFVEIMFICLSQETLNLKISEQEKKERVPIYTKVFQEVVREKVLFFYFFYSMLFSGA